MDSPAAGKEGRMAQIATRLDSLARSLAGFRAERGLAISIFLDLDPSIVPTAMELRSRVASVVDEARKRVAELTPELGHGETMGARDDLDAAESFLAEELDRSGARGFALYLAGRDGLRRELPLPTPVEDAAHVARTFALTPLLDALERDRDFVLVAVGRERGTLWRSRSGQTELLDDRTEEIARRHDQGGWSQARLQRSVDNDARAHFRKVADFLAQAIEPGSGTLVLVSCVEEQRPEFEELLASHVRELLLGWTASEAHAGPEALEVEAERLLEEQLGRERAALLERFGLARREKLATASWDVALEAAADGAIEAALVDGRSPEAWVCPQCGRGTLVPGACPLDGTRLGEEPGRALELVVRGTLVHSGEIRRAERLDDFEGVVVLLRFPVVVAS